MELTKEQFERYSRNILIQEIGLEGQKRLLESKVLIIGAGGLGSANIFYLAANGIGTIGVADYDRVDLTNLQRQIIHTTDDIGKEKIISVKEKINKLNPDVNLITYNIFINQENIENIIKDYDFVIDATDNFESKFLINDACVKNKKPYSHCGVSRFEGQTLTYLPGHTCYRCIFNSLPSKDSVPPTSKVGILGTIPGILGTIQATEAIKFLLKKGELLIDTLLIIDAYNMDIRKVSLKRDYNCPICSNIT